jgi:integrase
VFPSRRGGYLSPGEVRWVFDPAVEAVRAAIKAERERQIEETGQAQTPEFPVINPHELRHTCASLAISAGANVKVLQALLGHRQPPSPWTVTGTYFLMIWAVLRMLLILLRTLCGRNHPYD